MKHPPPLPPIPPLELDGFSLDIQYYIHKEYTDIAAAAIELPAIIERLYYEHQIALEMKLRTKAHLERREAQAFFELKQGDFQAKGYGDKITVDALKAAIELDPEVIELKEQYANWSAFEDRLDNSAKSISAKLEIVRSSEATRRKVFEH